MRFPADKGISGTREFVKYEGGSIFSCMEQGTKNLAVNKVARFNYEITDTIECGISLLGSEVKSMKSGRFTFSDSYGRIIDNEIWLVGFHIAQYPLATIENHEPDRKRKLLVHKQEIKKLKRKIDEKGFSLVPVRAYLKGGKIKMEMGIGVGKKLHDKRQVIKNRDEKRHIERELRNK